MSVWIGNHDVSLSLANLPFRLAEIFIQPIIYYPYKIIYKAYQVVKKIQENQKSAEKALTLTESESYLNEEWSRDNILGTITKIEALHGEINGGKYVFKRDILPNPHQLPPLNTLVEFSAIQKHRFDCWNVTQLRYVGQDDNDESTSASFITATDVPKHSVWDILNTLEKEEELHNKMLEETEKELFSEEAATSNDSQIFKKGLTRHIGMVTNVFRDKGCINEKIDFPITKCVHNFPITRGDWIIVELNEKWDENNHHSINENDIRRVYPLRLTAFRGRITQIFNNKNRYSTQQRGLIDDKITYFTDLFLQQSLVKNRSTKFSVGQIVEGIALESTQDNRSIHRALCMNVSANQSQQDDVNNQENQSIFFHKVMQLSNWIDSTSGDEHPLLNNMPSFLQFTPNKLDFDKMVIDNEKKSTIIISLNEEENVIASTTL